MSNSEITFGQVKKLCYSNEVDGEYFTQYINSFVGENIYEKFKTILGIWSNDVSPTLDLSLDRTTQLRINYLLSEFPEILGEPIIVEKDHIRGVIDIPKTFTHNTEIFPIYEILHQIETFDININLLDLDSYNKHRVIDRLPPNFYNDVVNVIMVNDSKVLKFSNPSLKNLKLNFLTNDPYMFLRELFGKYSKEYFRNVIYTLSKNMNGDLLLNSTLADVEYYVQRFNEDISAQENSPNGRQ